MTDKKFFFPVCALLLWGVWAFLPKLALQSLPPHGIIFYEALGSFALTTTIFLLTKKTAAAPRGRGLGFAAASAGASLCGILSYFYALGQGPVATVATITAMYPLVAVVLARVFLKERMNRRQSAAAVLALGAIWLLAG